MSLLKTDEDGFASVEDCFALLSKPPLQDVRIIHRLDTRPVDLRKKHPLRLHDAMRRSDPRGLDTLSPHWAWRTPQPNPSKPTRLVASFEVHLVLSCCADIDQLIELFEATKKLSA